MSELKEQLNMCHIFFYNNQPDWLLLILIILLIPVHILCLMQIIPTLKTTVLHFFFVGYTSHKKIFLSNNSEYKHCDSTSLSEIITIMSIVKLVFLSHWKLQYFCCHLYNNTSIYLFILLACIFIIFVILQFSKHIYLIE
jgi:hypothetical protein